MERLSEIQSKYKFRNEFDLEQEDVEDFCRCIIKAYHLGLNLEDADYEFIEEIIDKI